MVLIKYLLPNHQYFTFYLKLTWLKIRFKTEIAWNSLSRVGECADVLIASRLSHLDLSTTRQALAIGEWVGMDMFFTYKEGVYG